MDYFEEIKERLAFLVKTLARGKHTVFAKACGIPTPTFQAYYHGERIPSSDHLIKIKSRFGINLNWLLVGEGDPFIQEGGESKTPDASKVLAIDAAVQFLREAEEETGIALNPAQRQAILKILRKTLAQDRQNLKELIHSIGGKKDEGSR